MSFPTSSIIANWRFVNITYCWIFQLIDSSLTYKTSALLHCWWPPQVHDWLFHSPTQNCRPHYEHTAPAIHLTAANRHCQACPLVGLQYKKTVFCVRKTHKNLVQFCLVSGSSCDSVMMSSRRTWEDTEGQKINRHTHNCNCVIVYMYIVHCAHSLYCACGQHQLTQ